MRPRALSMGLLALLLGGVLVLAAANDNHSNSTGEGNNNSNGNSSSKEQGMTEGGSWTEVEKAVDEQRFQAALEMVEGLLAGARERGDEAEWTKALVRATQLRIGLHGYETAVRFLKDSAWPEDPEERVVLDLFYAHSLETYLQAYSWEIGQRERVVGDEEVDLKLWTREQIAAAADRAFLGAWKDREEWGRRALGTVAEYVEVNDYPAGIRDTLRDAVAYLWADLLGNSSLWDPAESNGLYRLDLAGLLESPPTLKRPGSVPAGVGGGAPDGEGSATAGAEAGRFNLLADATVHPLVKLAMVLDDLERWHAGAGRREAAFEARRSRIERLHQHKNRAEDRATLIEALQNALGRLGESPPWFSVGMATLAEMTQAGEEPDALVRARAIAQAGEGAHPGTVGGRRCRAIREGIEAPAFSLQAMATDGPDRRSLLVQFKNLPRLHLRAYRLDLARFVTTSRDWNLLPAWREIERLVQGGAEPDASWSVELPPTPDYRQHDAYVVPPLTEPALYVIAGSARESFVERNNRRSAVDFVLSDLVLVAQPEENGVRVRAHSGGTGAAIGGVPIELWRLDYQRGHRELETRTTDELGEVVFRVGGRQGQRTQLGNDDEVLLPEYLGIYGSGYALLAEHQGDPALLRLQPYPEESSPAEATAALVYTDRSVYRPQQDILWKVVAYRAGAEVERFAILAERDVTVELVDANGESVASEEVTTNDYGSASGRFSIPTGRLLGAWQVRASLGGATQVRVEEYKRPTFEVTILEPEAALRLNRPATLTGEAKYYFGLPVATGEIAWRVEREPVFPIWWGWWWRPQQEEREVVVAGDATLDADGRFQITFTPAADEREAKDSGISYRYRLTAEVTDEGGETRAGTRSFRLGFVAVEARIDDEREFLVEGEPASLAVVRSDLDGVPREGEARWRLVRLTQPETTLLPADQPQPEAGQEEEADRYRTPGDLLRPRWNANYSPEQTLSLWPDGEEVASGTLEHDSEGRAALPLPELFSGAYRLHYTTEDPFGATYALPRNFVVVTKSNNSSGRERDNGNSSSRGVLSLPAVLWAEAGSVPAGSALRVVVHSGLPDQQMVLEIRRRNRPVERRHLTSSSYPELLELPVDDADRGGLALRLSLLRDHQLVGLQQSVLVPWDDRELKVSFSTFRDRLRPGQTERWRVTVAGADEETLAAGAAEVLAYMYDKSLDLFAPHQPASLLGLYPGGLWVPQLTSSLGAAGEAWQNEQGWVPHTDYPYLSPDRLKFLDGYGIGGPGMRGRPMMMRDMAVAEAAPVPAGVTGGVLGGVPARELETIPTARDPWAVMAQTPGVAVDRINVGESGDGGAPAPELRTDFAETAFWEPHLVTGEDGSVAFEFEVPDSVTEWNVWAHAVTRDLRGGSLTKQARTVKELLVRPYLPRFLREGDQAALRVVVNNSGEEELTGTLDFELFDPESEAAGLRPGRSLAEQFGLGAVTTTAVPFTVAPGAGTTLEFPITVPARVGTVAFRVIGRAGEFSDGELRPLPVLPGRFHLVASRFAALRDASRRSLDFPKMREADPTRIDEQLVVTLDAQLFYGVLDALPYLVDYPYECTEQTLNRFLSTGIVSSVFEKYPAVARMAKKLSERDTQFETWDAADPNRKMTLEETPWLVTARGGGLPEEELIKVLDPRVARANRRSALAKLERAQTSLGGFPWWPGGPPSPYMTLYILAGFSRALEFGVEVPQDMVQRAWGYMHRHYLEEIVDDMVRHDCCWETVTLLEYVLSNYTASSDSGMGDSWTGGVFTAEERQRLREFSWKHWKEHSPLLKLYLALVMHRADRPDDASTLLAVVFDSAKTDPDLGTYWAPEDRAWLWYNDTVETHAFALRTLTELTPDDARRDGLVQWLFLNKQLNHWKSTKATAEAIYSLVYYLDREGQLGAREAATVTVGPRVESFVFEPDEFTGKEARVLIPGEELDPATMSTVVVEKDTPGLLFASATWHFSTEQLPAEAEGDLFAVERTYFKRVLRGQEWTLEPLAPEASLSVGDQLEVHLSIRAKHAAEYVHLRDPRPAGFEPETLTSGYKWDLGIGWYEEVRDSGTNFFFEWLPAGEYTFKYRLRANLAGTYKIAPAQLQSMYAPEFAGYSAGDRVAIEP